MAPSPATTAPGLEVTVWEYEHGGMDGSGYTHYAFCEECGSTMPASDQQEASELAEDHRLYCEFRS